EEIDDRSPANPRPARVLVEERLVIGGRSKLRIGRAINLVHICGSYDLIIDAAGMHFVGGIEDVGCVCSSASDVHQSAHFLYLFGLQGRFLQQEAAKKCLSIWHADAHERSRIGKRKQMPLNSAQTTLRKGIAGGSEESRELELGPGEIDEAIWSEVAEVVLES